MQCFTALSVILLTSVVQSMVTSHFTQVKKGTHHAQCHPIYYNREQFCDTACVHVEKLFQGIGRGWVIRYVSDTCCTRVIATADMLAIRH